MGRYKLIFLVLILSISLVSAVDYDAEVLNDIQNHNSAKVIVLLEQQSQGSIGSQSINDVNQLQQQVLDFEQISRFQNFCPKSMAF